MSDRGYTVDLVQCRKCLSRNVRVRSGGDNRVTILECRACQNSWKEASGTIFARVLIRE